MAATWNRCVNPGAEEEKTDISHGHVHAGEAEEGIRTKTQAPTFLLRTYPTLLRLSLSWDATSLSAI